TTLGQPISNTRFYVLSGNNKLLPVGVIGELFIGGAGLARGYLNRPALTQEAFVMNPFSDEKGARLYKTGDLVRWLADGSLEFIGRKDDQVKIRGFRIELGEIEAALTAINGVRQAVVRVQDEPARLVAFLVAESEAIEQSTFLEQSRSRLELSLPQYMIPSIYRVIDELPLTANGKVDRKQLPIVDANQSLQRYIAPKTATEVALCAIWQALLGVERVGLDDNFFRLGGHSLLVMRLLADIRQEIDVELSVRDLFDVSDLGLQARLIDTLGAGTSLSSITAIDRHSNQLPLSFAQQRVWFINQMEGGSSHYNMPLALTVTGGFDVSIAQRAFTQIIQRHETLRTVFSSRNGEAVQLIRSHFKFTLAEQDISGLSIAEQQQLVLAQLKLDADKVFDLEHDLMLRASYIRQSSDEGVLLFNMHHIASDGWSAGVLVNEFTTIYKALHNGLTAVSEALPIQYVDYAHWQREYLQGEMALEQMSYWQAQLADLPPVHSLPLDFSRPQQQRFNGAIYRFDFDLDLLRKLKQTASQHKVTLFMLLHGMFSLMLSRYSNNSDIAIGVPVANRMQKELEGLIGFFVNTIVLRTDVSEEQTLSEYLSHVRTVNVGAQDHQQLPFDYLVEQLNPHRSTAYSPLFQVMFSMDRDQLANLEIASNSFDDIAFEPLLNDDVGSKFDLTLNAIESSDGVLLSFEYNTDLFLAATIERFGDHFLRLLQALASDESLGENDLSEFSMLSDQETDYLLEDLNRTESAYPSELCVHELFEQQVKLNPNAVALVFEAQELTFTELNSRSNRLAHYLVANGVRPDSLVGLCVERSVELVVAILAILKSGGAYMPLEPSYPQARLGYMLDDSKVELLLTMSHIANSLPAGEHRSILLDDEGAFSNCASHNLSAEELALTSNHLAYVIYTSGSAGQPKGVLQQHKTLNNLVHHQVSDRYLTKPMNSVLLTNMGFDVFMQELATAWYLGSRLYLYRDDLRIDTAKLLNVISEHGIQRLFLVPAVFNALMDSSAQLSTGISGLREVIVAGERLNMTEQVKNYLNCSNTFLINHYGPTETHVVTTFNVVAEDKRHNVLIGNALANHKLYVLGKNLKPIPSGAIGELHVSGVGLARGYLNQAELTQEKFIADPFSGDEGGRLYKTGDLVRRLADGNMEYIGRADDQVKVRGFRIELGEVESALSSIDGVGDAVVVARDEPTRLVAYVTTKAGLQTNDLRATFKAQLQQRLPDYMVPSLFIELDDLPLNANGKLDRQALPEPDASIAQHEYVAPSTEAEKVLCTIWQRLLGVQRIGVTDNFFELGGHSLLAMRLVSEVRSQCNVELVVRDIFNTTQLSDLAALLESAAQNTQLAKIDIVDRSTTSMSLSYSQERLWFIDQMMSGSEHYNLPIALRVSGSFDVTLAEQALQQIIARHEPLRTVYKQTQEGAVQRIATDVDFHLGQQDISQLSVSDQLAVIAERTQSDASLAFNLEQDLMLRAHYLRVSDDSGVLLFNMHHIASDGWSIRILVAEFTTIYQALCSATEPSLLTLTVQYADYAHWQRQQLNSHKLDDQLVYWQTQLAELPTVHELPLDHARPEHQSFNGSVHTIKTDEALFTKLKASAIVNDVTLFMLLQGAFSLLLARHSNTSDIVMGTPMANRLHTDVEGLIGFFVNTLVLRIDVSQATTLSDYLAHVKAVNVDAQMNQQIPFDYLVEQLNPPRSTSYSPLFQVMFSMDINEGSDNQHSPIILEGVEFETLNHDVVAAKFELSLNVTKSDNGLQLSFEYNTDLFNQATVVRLGDHFLRLLDGFANSEDAHAESVRRLPMLSEHETRYLVDDLNNLESDYPAEQCVHELFEAQVALNPDAIALEFEAQELSYGELNKRSNQLAHHLVSHGVKPDTLVGLCVERSLEMVIGILGILKAGGAYVPLDPTYPDARLSYMLSDSGVELLLTQSDLLEKIPTSDQHIIILDDDKNLLLESSENLDKNKLKLTPAHLAYVIYTSGSTGQPKGVMVEHNNVTRLFRSSEKHFGFTSNDVWALFHSYAFDFSVWELW
ncbi:MAG: amino acid adenylation domain-containing protein, partial [Arenicella sp.]|nr:amino acid adenylation domain-containing protein [Arenicella sp.]